MGPDDNVVGAARLPPIPHRVAIGLADRGIRGASYYWALAARLAPLPAVGVVTVTKGATVRLPLDDWLGRETYRHLGDRTPFIALRRLLRAGDRVVDVGANLGVYSACLASLVGPTGRVASFEPSPRVLPWLRANMASFGQVDVHSVALSDSSGTRTLFGTDDPRHGGLASLESHMATSEGATEIESRRPTDVLGEGWEELALVKIDVEGHEPAVLRGFAPWLEERRIAALLVEVSPRWGGTAVFDEIEALAGPAYRAFACREVGRFVRHPTLVSVGRDDYGDGAEQENVFFLTSSAIDRLRTLVGERPS
jgi:FkbM family methyltransferase